MATSTSPQPVSAVSDIMENVCTAIWGRAEAGKFGGWCGTSGWLEVQHYLARMHYHCFCSIVKTLAHCMRCMRVNLSLDGWVKAASTE